MEFTQLKLNPNISFVSSNGQYLVIKVSVTYKGDQRKVAGFFFHNLHYVHFWMEEFSSPSWVHCSSQLITIYTYNALKKRPWKEVYPWIRHDCNNNPMYGIRSQIIQRLVKLLFFFQSWLLVANVNREATSVLVMAFGFIGKTLKTSLWRGSSEM